MKRKIALRIFILFFIPFIWQAKANPITTLVAPPANDECSAAIDLTVNPNYLCSVVTAGTITDATASTAPNGCPGTPANANDDVWFKFVATSIAHRISITNVVASVGTNDLYHMVYDGGASADCATMSAYYCSNPEESNLNIANTGSDLVIGNTYFIRVFTNSSASGANVIFDICIGTTSVTPANDDCANAQAITATDINPYSETVDASGATNNNGFITASGCMDTNDGVWYTVTAPLLGEISITVSPSAWNSSIVVYSGSCGSLVCVEDANPGGIGIVENLKLEHVPAGTTYYVNIAYPSGTVDGSEGIFALNVEFTPDVVSIEDIIAKGFYYYPNPVKNKLKVTAKEHINQISIYTVLGREIKKLSEDDLSDFNAEIDFSNLPRGTYFVRAVVGGDSGVFKIIKE